MASSAKRIRRLSEKAADFIREHVREDVDVTIIVQTDAQTHHLFHACACCEAKKLKAMARQIEKEIAESN